MQYIKATKSIYFSPFLYTYISIYRVTRSREKNINFLHKLHIMYTEFYFATLQTILSYTEPAHSTNTIPPSHPPSNSTLKFFMYTILFDGWVFLCGFFLLLIFMCATSHPSTLSIYFYFFFFCCVPFKETMSRLGFALMKYETFYGKLCTKYIKKMYSAVCCRALLWKWKFSVWIRLFHHIFKRQYGILCTTSYICV